MALFEKPETPAFDDALRQLETSDKAHATLFNTLVSKLFVNTLFLKKKAEENATAIDTAYQNGNAYTDQKIADLINGAPTTLDTLKEVADALATNDDVVVALNTAVGERAKQTELDTHTGNTTVHITASERTKWDEITQVKADTAENSANIDTLTQSLLDVEDKTKWKLIATINAKTSTTVNLSQYNEIRIEPYNVSLADAYQQVGSYPVSALSATIKRIDVPVNHACRARYNVTLTNITLLLASEYNGSTDYTIGMTTYVYAR